MKTYDILVYGATGFTGRQVAIGLAHAARPQLRLAIAGRRLDALKAVAAGLGRDVGILCADSQDAVSVGAMCAQTRVLVNTAGPFALHGSHVVAGCVEHATHYTDITGETPWVRDMIDQHGARAYAHQARIVPFCGYDSIPSDVSAWLAVRALSPEARAGRVQVEVFHRGRGGFNGGTLATALNIAAAGRLRDLAKPFLLNDQPLDPTPLERDPVAVGAARDLPGHRRRFPAPFFMSPINSRVVRRSVELSARLGEPWAARVEYQEYWAAQSRREATVLALGTRAYNRGIVSPMVRKLIGRFGPQPGEGPSEQAMNSGRFEAVALATADNGEKGWAEMSGPGDPGNRVTTQCVLQSALCLAEDDLPLRYGFLTPTTAFGERLVERLRAVGMTLTSGRG